MPSMNTYTVVRWRVNWAGNSASVVPDGPADSISILVQDGGPASPDSQVIAQYLLNIADPATRQAVTQAVADGLFTLLPVQKTSVTTPPVPPRILAVGPPKAP